jgi:hypothetical protein
MVSAVVFTWNLRVQYVWSAQYTRNITANKESKMNATLILNMLKYYIVKLVLEK